MKQYNSPTGERIIGTAEHLLATAQIQGINDDGTPEYAGGSDIHWDTQETLERDGKILFTDAAGGEWTFDQLVAVKDPNGAIFNAEEIKLIHAEGWDIFEASGSAQNHDGDRPFQLQRLDEEGILDDDDAAWRLVHQRANEGSPVHQKALSFLREESPAEHAAIVKFCQN